MFSVFDGQAEALASKMTLAHSTQDTFLVAWSKSNAGYDVQARVFDASGVLVADSFQVNVQSSGKKIKPLAFAHGDGFAAIWSKDSEAYVRLLSSAGEPLGNEQLIGGSFLDAGMVGSAFLTTNTASCGSGCSDVIFNRCPIDGAPCLNEKANVCPGGKHGDSEIIVFGDGSSGLAWSYGTNTYLQLYDEDGKRRYKW